MVIYSKEEKRLIIPEGLGATGTDCEARYREGYREGYRDGLDDCDCSGSTDCSSAITEAYQEGYADGLDANCGEAIEEAYQSGYTAGQADCPECDCSSAVTEAYQSGQTAGAAAQKALLTSTAITENGTYTRENGWNEVFVNVPQSGYTEGWDDGFMSGAGVELVDYVHSTNMGNNVEEYLVTNIIPTKYTKAKFAGQYKQYTTYGVLVGFNDSDDSQDWRLFVFENGAPIIYGVLEMMFDVGLTRTEMGAGDYSVNDDLWFEWGYESGSTIMRSPQINRTFAMVDREPAQGHIKINMGIMWVSSVQIWDNGTLVFNGKAAKRNNDYGLWDSVSKTFLTDANLNLVGETNLNNN